MSYRRRFNAIIALCVSLCLSVPGMSGCADDLAENGVVPDASAGDYSGKQYSEGKYGEEKYDEGKYDEEPSSGESYGEKSYSGESYGEEPYSGESSGEEPSSGESSGEESPSGEPYGEESSSGESSGKELSSEEPYGGESSGGETYGEGQYGARVMEVEGWNTYDEAGNPTPAHDTSGYVVAVVDSGVDYRHDDLKNVMWDEGLEYPSLVQMGGGKYGICTCHNDTSGHLYDSADPLDDYGHGTHVAGIVAAEWNGRGVSGIASGARIMAVKISNDKGTHSLDEAVRAYEYIIEAKKAGVNIRAVNNSWHDYVFGHTMDKLVREAGKLGIVSIFAAGNQKANIDPKDIMSSALYDNPYAVVVGAANEDGVPTEYSNYGHKNVDLFAPGDWIYSTIPLFKGFPDGNGDVMELDLSGFHSAEGLGKCDLSLEKVDGVGDLLKVANDNEDDMLLIESDRIGDVSGSVGIGAELYLEEKAVVSIMCWDPDGGYETEPSISEASEIGPGLCTVTTLFPENMDLTDMRFGLSVNKGYEGNTDVYIKRVMICKDVLAYGFMSGTSMAAPAVTGEAITVISEYPDEPADKIAARIKGGVRHMDPLEKYCISGGMASLDKALKGDADPVMNDTVNYVLYDRPDDPVCGDDIRDDGAEDPADVSDDSVAGGDTRDDGPEDPADGGDTRDGGPDDPGDDAGMLTISGFFFGEDEGTVLLNGRQYRARTWSDHEITVPIPSDFEAGEYRIEVVTSEGRKTYRYDRIGRPALLYDRLSLPGRKLSKETGEYTVTSNEYDDTFYCDEVKSLVGLGGNLYAVISARDGRTAIYCYDIAEDSWSMVYHGGHAASDGACTWNNRLMFLAIDEYDNHTWLDIFDPATNDVTYHTLSETGLYKNVTLISTAKGVFGIGGEICCHDTLGTSEAFDKIMYLDEEDWSFKPVIMKNEDIPLYVDAPACVCDEAGDIYIIGGMDDRFEKNEIYKVEFDENAGAHTADLQLIHSEEPIIDDALPAQAHRLRAVPANGGIMLTGRVQGDQENNITADTYFGEYGAVHFEPTGKMVSLSPVYSAVAAAYRGRFYVLGMTNYENGQHVFAAGEVTTID